MNKLLHTYTNSTTCDGVYQYLIPFSQQMTNYQTAPNRMMCEFTDI